MFWRRKADPEDTRSIRERVTAVEILLDDLSEQLSAHLDRERRNAARDRQRRSRDSRTESGNDSADRGSGDGDFDLPRVVVEPSAEAVTATYERTPETRMALWDRARRKLQ